MEDPQNIPVLKNTALLAYLFGKAAFVRTARDKENEVRALSTRTSFGLL
ncbi:hypothetical protein [Butyricicoccus pullicaecorum]|nr:hypothetical protein [Butyricicoccus pullicaecorum]HJF53502.1 hypothetical protein [Butyricicoccus pullicaecorum]